MGYGTRLSDDDARRLSRRSLLRGVVGVSALAILTACGQQASSPAEQPAPKPTEAAKPAESKPAEAAKPAAPAAAAQPTTAPAAAAPASKPGQNVELRFAWWGSQDRHDRTIKAIQLFEQKNPGFKMSYEFAGFQDHLTKMTTQATGGNLPDLMQQDYAWISQWVGNGLLRAMDDYVASQTRARRVLTIDGKSRGAPQWWEGMQVLVWDA